MHADSFDGRMLGCMGRPALEGVTPNLDRLAAEGTIFENTYSTYPLCCPARASMWSGRFAHNIEAWNNSRGLEPDSPTAVSRINKAGYHTRILGRSDYLSGSHSITARVGSWTRAAAIPRPVHGESKPPRVLPEGEKRAKKRDWETVDEAGDWIREAAQADGKPFMLSLGIHSPHHPFLTSPEYLDRIAPERVVAPPEDTLDHPLLPLQRLQKNWGHAMEPEAMHLRRRMYFAMIAEIDDMVGRILKKLDELGLRDCTWVFFTSDHGEMLGEHRQYIKLTHFEASIRVPLIVSGPGAQKGKRVKEPVSLVDIHPTLVELAGLEPAAECDGLSLVPELTGGTTSKRPNGVFAEYHSTCCPTGSFMLCSGEWKYQGFPGYPALLFNLREDPDELTDLSKTQPDKCAEMDKQLRQIVDYETVDRRAKEYDRAQFSLWREQHLREGDYRDIMGAVYSDNPHDPQPWRDEDEDRIIGWLEG